ncbi:MAG: molybdopterin-dependent oxidoreductase [Dehalococcoidia bacterium]
MGGVRLGRRLRRWLPMDRARLDGTVLAYQMNGEALSVKLARLSLRVVTPGTSRHEEPKWLTRIDVVAAPIVGFWEQSGWDANGVEDDGPVRHPAGAGGEHSGPGWAAWRTRATAASRRCR